MVRHPSVAGLMYRTHLILPAVYFRYQPLLIGVAKWTYHRPSVVIFWRKPWKKQGLAPIVTGKAGASTTS
jgi:hypothetical protein